MEAPGWEGWCLWVGLVVGDGERLELVVVDGERLSEGGGVVRCVSKLQGR